MNICKECEGTGRLGFQREHCYYCDGSGYIKKKILLNKQVVEDGLNNLIKRQLKIIKELSKDGAYTEQECKERLKLIKEKELIDYTLSHLFSLQSTEYTKPDYGGVTVVD